MTLLATPEDRQTDVEKRSCDLIRSLASSLEILCGTDLKRVPSLPPTGEQRPKRLATRPAAYSYNRQALAKLIGSSSPPEEPLTSSDPFIPEEEAASVPNLSEDLTHRFASEFLRHVLLHLPQREWSKVFAIDFDDQKLPLWGKDYTRRIGRVALLETKRALETIIDGQAALSDACFAQIIGQALSMRLQTKAWSGPRDTIFVITAARHYMRFLEVHIPEDYVQQLRESQDHEKPSAEFIKVKATKCMAQQPYFDAVSTPSAYDREQKPEGVWLECLDKLKPRHWGRQQLVALRVLVVESTAEVLPLFSDNEDFLLVSAQLQFDSFSHPSESSLWEKDQVSAQMLFDLVKGPAPQDKVTEIMHSSFTLFRAYGDHVGMVLGPMNTLCMFHKRNDPDAGSVYVSSSDDENEDDLAGDRQLPPTSTCKLKWEPAEELTHRFASEFIRGMLLSLPRQWFKDFAVEFDAGRRELHCQIGQIAYTSTDDAGLGILKSDGIFDRAAIVETKRAPTTVVDGKPTLPDERFARMIGHALSMRTQSHYVWALPKHTIFIIVAARYYMRFLEVHITDKYMAQLQVRQQHEHPAAEFIKVKATKWLDLREEGSRNHALLNLAGIVRYTHENIRVPPRSRYAR
ncbi:hypothetical protein DV735_g2357, partial [Chaetothyriales sp. CBS 134920]